MKIARALSAACAIGLLAVACSGDDGGMSPPLRPTEGESPAVTGTQRWVAIFEVAEDPNDLDSRTQEFLRRVDTATIVSPAGCFEGSPIVDLQPEESGYVLGVETTSEAELDRLLARIGEEPLFRGMVDDHCIE